MNPVLTLDCGKVPKMCYVETMCPNSDFRDDSCLYQCRGSKAVQGSLLANLGLQKNSPCFLRTSAFLHFPLGLGTCFRSVASNAENSRPTGLKLEYIHLGDYQEVLTQLMGKYSQDFPYFSPDLPVTIFWGSPTAFPRVSQWDFECPFHSENCILPHTFQILVPAKNNYYLFIYCQLFVFANLAIKCVHFVNSLRSGKNTYLKPLSSFLDNLKIHERIADENSSYLSQKFGAWMGCCNEMMWLF